MSIKVNVKFICFAIFGLFLIDITVYGETSGRGCQKLPANLAMNDVLPRFILL